MESEISFLEKRWSRFPQSYFQDTLKLQVQTYGVSLQEVSRNVTLVLLANRVNHSQECLPMAMVGPATLATPSIML